jgi:hypothetical protein
LQADFGWSIIPLQLAESLVFYSGKIMSDEPTILDYFKALMTPWRGAPPPIPPLEVGKDVFEPPVPTPDAGVNGQTTITVGKEYETETIREIETSTVSLPWRAFIALGVAIIAQLSLEPGPTRTWGIGLGLYIFGAAWVVWANIRQEWVLPDIPFIDLELDSYTIRQVYMWIGAGLCILAFIMLGGNRFNMINVIIWLSSIICIIYAFWLPDRQRTSWIKNTWEKITQRKWEIKFSRWTYVLIIASICIIFFRLYRLNTVPPQMFSDHAEKLLDVWDILHGDLRIFFPRNTGREAIQMYITAGVVSLFRTGYTFTSLKIGTTLLGLITLPFVYLFGKEIANRRVGLFAMVITGIAYWPNIITRVGLRFPLYPLFVAIVLYFLVRGIRRSSRNDFILAGVALGLGLHGYSPFRIVPFVTIIAVVIFLLHSESRGLRWRTILYTGLMVTIALVIFIPLLRVWVDSPGAIWFRTLTRLGTIERPFPGPPWQIFVNNFWNAMIMFGWNNGETWPTSVTNRPALDVISSAFFYLGIVLIFVRYIRNRNWLDVFLLLSVPLLLLPSILSLAFPAENPALNRTAGALVPVFIIVGLSMDGFLRGLESHTKGISGTSLAWIGGIVLFAWIGYQNFDLVFNQYQNSFSQLSWNTTELGQVIREFTDTIGEEENAYVVAYPHWVDTRLVGFNAGFPTKDFAIWPEDFQKTVEDRGSKLFLIKIDDIDSRVALQTLYPSGVLERFTSEVPNKDFYKFYVFPE